MSSLKVAKEVDELLMSYDNEGLKSKQSIEKRHPVSNFLSLISPAQEHFPNFQESLVQVVSNSLNTFNKTHSGMEIPPLKEIMSLAPAGQENVEHFPVSQGSLVREVSDSSIKEPSYPYAPLTFPPNPIKALEHLREYLCESQDSSCLNYPFASETLQYRYPHMTTSACSHLRISNFSLHQYKRSTFRRNLGVGCKGQISHFEETTITIPNPTNMNHNLNSSSNSGTLPKKIHKLNPEATEYVPLAMRLANCKNHILKGLRPSSASEYDFWYEDYIKMACDEIKAEAESPYRRKGKLDSSMASFQLDTGLVATSNQCPNCVKEASDSSELLNSGNSPGNSSFDCPKVVVVDKCGEYKDLHLERNKCKMSINDEEMVLFLGEDCVEIEQLDDEFLSLKDCEVKILDESGFVDYLMGDSRHEDAPSKESCQVGSSIDSDAATSEGESCCNVAEDDVGGKALDLEEDQSAKDESNEVWNCEEEEEDSRSESEGETSEHEGEEEEDSHCSDSEGGAISSDETDEEDCCDSDESEDDDVLGTDDGLVEIEESDRDSSEDSDWSEDDDSDSESDATVCNECDTDDEVCFVAEDGGAGECRLNDSLLSAGSEDSAGSDFIQFGETPENYPKVEPEQNNILTSEDSDDEDSDCDYDCDIFDLEFDSTDWGMPGGGLMLSNLVQCVPNGRDEVDCCARKEECCSYPMDEELVKVNKRWNNEIDLNCSANTPPKITFCDDVIIHVAADWCRKGQWEECARDRMRFKRRIEETEHVLSSVLKPEHRQKVFTRLMHSDGPLTKGVQKA